MYEPEAQHPLFARRPGLWLALFVAVLCTQVGPWFYAEWDACAYLSAARSVAHDGELSSLGEPGPGGITTFPLLLWPAFLFGDRPFLAVGILQLLFAIVTMLGVYVWAERIMPESRVLLAGLSCLNAMFLLHLRRPLKEVAVLAFLIWTVNILHWAMSENRSRRAAVWGFVGAMLLGVTVSLRFATCVFGAAFVVPVAWTAFRDPDRRRPAIAALLGFVIPGILGTAYLLALGEPLVEGLQTKVIAAFGFIGEQKPVAYVEGAHRELGEITRITVPGMFKAYANGGRWLHPFSLMILITTALLVVGWWHFVRTRRVRDVFILGLPLYLCAYMAWPYDQGARFTVVMLPAAMACVWMGMVLPLRLPGWAMAASVVCHASVGIGYWILVDMPRAIDHDEKWPQVELLAEVLPDDEACVAVNIEWQLVAMLQLETDQRIEELQSADGLAEGTDWVVIGTDAPTPATFRTVVETDDYRLLTRDETVPLARDESNTLR